MQMRTVVACAIGAALLLLALGVVAVKPHAQAGVPEEAITRAIRALNEKNLDLLLTTLDPAKANAVRALREQLQGYVASQGIPWLRFLNVLPGLNQIAGNPIPDDWKFAKPKIKNKKVEDDLAWISISTRMTIYVREIKTARDVPLKVILRQFRPSGWKIVDCQLDTPPAEPPAHPR